MEGTILESFISLANDKMSIQSVKEATTNKLQTSNVNDFFTVRPVKTGTPVAIINPVSKISHAITGCEPEITKINPSAYLQHWNLKRIGFTLQFCYTDFDEHFTTWGLGKGISAPDLNEADFVDFLVDLISDGLKEDFLRIALFGDKNISEKPFLSNKSNAVNYNQIDMGLIPSLEYFKTQTPFQNNFIELKANYNAETVNYDHDNPLNAKGIFQKVLKKSRRMKPNILLSSDSLYLDYKEYLQNMPNLESSKTQTQEGVNNLRIDRYNVTPMIDYDRFREEDFTHIKEGGNGYRAKVTHMPHFALSARKEDLVIGVDSKEAITDFKIMPPVGSSNYCYIKGQYQMDFKITNPYKVVAAF